MPRIIPRNQRTSDVQRGSSAPTILSAEYENLARDLSHIHGTVRITQEASGTHFYMACPNCLNDSGEDELFKMHLAFNADKYLSHGQSVAAMCMKTGDTFNIMDLLAMPPLEERGHPDHAPVVITKQEANAEYLEDDGRGNLVPKSPGTVIPIIDLPADHPAQQYLASRGFDPVLLYDQFRLSYCTQERSDIHYRKLINGFRATPQERIVFYIIQNELTVGWQARILEMDYDDKRWFLHPYKRQWMPVLQLNEGAKPTPLPGWEDWGNPAKYICAHGCFKSSCLMGYDAALAYTVAERGLRWCVLVEGPLDAARIGPPAMAIMGKSISANQTKLIVEAGYDRVLYVADDDVAGAQASASLQKQFAAVGKSNILTIIKPPEGYKDMGEVPTTEEAFNYVCSHL